MSEPSYPLLSQALADLADHVPPPISPRGRCVPPGS